MGVEAGTAFASGLELPSSSRGRFLLESPAPAPAGASAGAAAATGGASATADDDVLGCSDVVAALGDTIVAMFRRRAGDAAAAVDVVVVPAAANAGASVALSITIKIREHE
jgi:hypothetical protein